MADKTNESFVVLSIVAIVAIVCIVAIVTVMQKSAVVSEANALGETPTVVGDAFQRPAFDDSDCESHSWNDCERYTECGWCNNQEKCMGINDCPSSK